ncbi:MAG: ABC transporter permease subunit [Bacteroidetes bacterium]|nr:ABC transporter permease subunit [Bacteroidota bacterium]MCW5894653.1 ABC transporter permease subunit [Bacteroidota bacterium]
MTRLILFKELREIVASSKFAVTFGVCSLLILLSFYVGAKNWQIGNEQYEASKRENLRAMETMTDWSEVRNHRIFLPPRPIASLVNGVSNDIGRTAEIRGSGDIAAQDSRYGEDPIYAVFRFLDLDFIIQIVLSLFAILFAYDSINGEKERGTLRLTFANPIPRTSYILGKMAGSVLGLAVPLLIPILLGCLILIAAGIPMQWGDWVRLSLVIAAGYLYFSVFLAVSMFVSAATQKSSTSFLMLLVIWIFSVMILPRTAVLLAGRAVDVPSVDEIASKRSRYSASLWQEQRKAMADFRAPENLPPEEMMKEFQKFMSNLGSARDKNMQEFASRLNEERKNRQQVQERLAFGLARVSPSAVFSFASTTVAGTGLHLKDEYKLQAERYQQAFAEFIKGKTGTSPSGAFIFRITTDTQEEKKPINPAELPVFAFQPPSLSASMRSIAVDLGILILFCLIFFAGAFISFLRYDVR